VELVLCFILYSPFRVCQSTTTSGRGSIEVAASSSKQQQAKQSQLKQRSKQKPFYFHVAQQQSDKQLLETN